MTMTIWVTYSVKVGIMDEPYTSHWDICVDITTEVNNSCRGRRKKIQHIIWYEQDMVYLRYGRRDNEGYLLLMKWHVYAQLITKWQWYLWGWTRSATCLYEGMDMIHTDKDMYYDRLLWHSMWYLLICTISRGSRRILEQFIMQLDVWYEIWPRIW